MFLKCEDKIPYKCIYAYLGFAVGQMSVGYSKPNKNILSIYSRQIVRHSIAVVPAFQMSGAFSV